MSVHPLDAPRPLPPVPCPVYDGHPVQWEPWAAIAPMTHVDPSCPACAHPGPLSMAMGKVMPLEGETFESTRQVKARRTGRTYEKGTRVPAWPFIALSARLCPQCFNLELSSMVGSYEVESILCDGCDALVAAGANLEEARRTLVDLYGGWSAPGADWDLCRSCNPAATADAPPRALAAFAASRVRPA